MSGSIILWNTETERWETSSVEKTIEERKAEVLDGIGENTKQLTSEGFPFDGHIFPIDETARNKWAVVGLFYARVKTDPDVIWPEGGHPLFTLDDGLYLLSFEKANEFFTVAYARGAYLETTDFIEKKRVETMTTIEELNNYVDERV